VVVALLGLVALAGELWVSGPLAMAATTGVQPAPALEAGALTVSPAGAAQGATVTLVFAYAGSIPASSVQIEIPVGVTTYVPVAPTGWTTSVTGTSLRWDRGPGPVPGTRSFEVRLGPMPAAPSVGFPATVGLQDGTIERWDGTDAVRPVPTVTLTPDPRAVQDQESTGSATHDPASHDAAAPTPAVAPPAVSSVIDGTAIAAVVLAGVGIAAGWGTFALRRSRRGTRRPAS
jgi:hypothetical protein